MGCSRLQPAQTTRIKASAAIPRQLDGFIGATHPRQRPRLNTTANPGLISASPAKRSPGTEKDYPVPPFCRYLQDPSRREESKLECGSVWQPRQWLLTPSRPLAAGTFSRVLEDAWA